MRFFLQFSGDGVYAICMSCTERTSLSSDNEETEQRILLCWGHIVGYNCWKAYWRQPLLPLHAPVMRSDLVNATAPVWLRFLDVRTLVVVKELDTTEVDSL